MNINCNADIATRGLLSKAAYHNIIISFCSIFNPDLCNNILQIPFCPFTHTSAAILDKYPKYHLVDSYIEKLSPCDAYVSSFVLLVNSIGGCYANKGVEYSTLSLCQFVVPNSYDPGTATPLDVPPRDGSYPNNFL
jgi:hypothetical protein